MSNLQHAVGIALFIFILSLTTIITRYAVSPIETIPALPISILPPDSQQEPHPVSYKVKLVSIDFSSRKTYTTLALTKEFNRPAPDRAWVWTYFFSPDRPGVRWSSAPVEIQQPFAKGETATITATGSCDWCDDVRAPRTGYYARVNVSTQFRDAAHLREDQMKDDITTAMPVLVQAERRASR